MKNLLTKIVNLIIEIKNELIKIDEYFYKNNNISCSVTSTASGWAVTDVSASVRGNEFIFNASINRTGAQISSGTSVKTAVATISFSPATGVIFPGAHPLAIYGVYNGSGPIVTIGLTTWTVGSDNSLTAKLEVYGTAGGAIPSNSACPIRLVTVVRRAV